MNTSIVRIIGDLYEFGIDATYDYTGGGVDYAHIDLSDKSFLWVNEDTVFIVSKKDSEKAREVFTYKGITDLSKKLGKKFQIGIDKEVF
jgi:hypothetical protein